MTSVAKNIKAISKKKKNGTKMLMVLGRRYRMLFRIPSIIFLEIFFLAKTVLFKKSNLFTYSDLNMHLTRK